jgi:hypothetical protein
MRAAALEAGPGQHTDQTCERQLRELREYVARRPLDPGAGILGGPVSCGDPTQKHAR